MEKSTKVLAAARQAPLSEVMQELANALVGAGPALGFGPIVSSAVQPSIAVAVATSGSTGAPKEVGLSASALLASATSSNKYLEAEIGEVWSLLLPLTHIAGVNVLIRSLQLGTSPIDLRSTTEYSRADFTAIVPTQLFRALNTGDPDQKLFEHLRNCKAVLVGGGALSYELAGEAEERGINVITTYGMTETSGGCVYDGTPFEGVEIKIESEIIMIKGSVLATTYLNDEATWNNSIENGWFVTKDRGEFAAGRLKVLGRVDDVMISGGKKLSLSAIEGALTSKYPRCQMAAFSLKEKEWGDALHLAVVGGAEISNEDISSFLKESFGSISKPKGIIRIDAIPLTAIGKVDRVHLQSLVEKSEAK